MEKQMGGNVILAYVQPPNVMCSRAPVDPPMHQYCVQTNVQPRTSWSHRPIHQTGAASDHMWWHADNDDERWLIIDELLSLMMITDPGF